MVPHDRHEAVATAVLKAGRHLLLEKPMAPTVDACARILAAAEEAGTVFMVAENAQYWPEVVTAKNLIEAGAIGEVITARAWHCAPPMDEFYRGDDPWRLSAGATGGGIAIDTGSHWLRPLRMWLGEIDEVVAVTGRVMDDDGGGVAVPGAVPVRRRRRGELRRSSLPGSGRARCPVPAHRAPRARSSSSTDESCLYDGTEARGTVHGSGQLLPELRSPDRRLRGGGPRRNGARRTSAEFALGELRAALAMYRSAQSGRWESVW